MRLRLVHIIAFLLILIRTSSQCPSVGFSLGSATVCQGEGIALTNTSVNASGYNWYFCDEGGLSGTGAVVEDSILSLFDKAFKLKTVEYSGGRYSFVTSTGNNKLFRIDHGSSVRGTLDELHDLGDFGGALSAPLGVDLVELSNGDWVGFVSMSSGGLVRLEFGPDLTSLSPSSEVLTGLTTYGAIGTVREVVIVEEGGSYQLLAVGGSGTNSLVILDFGTDLLSDSPSESSFTLTGSNTPTGLSVINDCNGWYGLLSSFSGGVEKISFGPQIDNTPLAIESVDNSISNAVSSSIIEERGRYYGVVTASDNKLYRIDLGADLSVNSGVVVDDLGSYGVLSDPRAFSLYREGGIVYGLGLNRGNDTYFEIEFTHSPCESSDSLSSETTPTGITYNSSGTYTIYLTAVNEAGNRQTASKQVTVTGDTAPDIDFSIDDNRCITNANTFTSINTSGDIESYSWDFDGDGAEDSDEQNPTYRFGSAGTYTVRLEVASTGGCTNFAEREVTIYEEPPVPSFEVDAETYCIGSEIQVTNLTDDAAYGEGISYLWSVTDLSNTITQGDISLSFEEPGEKIIRVQAIIPGCSSVFVSDTILVNDNPEIDFQASAVCSGEVMSFTNLAEGISYSWDFGDGYISTAYSPEHLYTVSGNYLVSLSTTDINGCVSTVSKEVIVSAIPEPEFDYDIVCQGEQTILRDVSIVNGADIAEWEWYVGGELVSNQKSPELVFSSTEDQMVTLTVYATNGCEASYTESIGVLAEPDALFSANIGCFGSNSTFEDISSDQDEIANRVWMINGQPLSTDGKVLSYGFDQPGTYEVGLVIDNQNLCSGSYTQTVKVLESPIIDFVQNSICENETISVSDNSLASNDPIVSRTWFLEGVKIGNGLNALVPVGQDGAYEVSLRATTRQGCSITTSKVIEVKPTPGADFSSSNDYGVPPFNLQMTNLTENGSSYKWYVNDQLFSTEENPSLLFITEGQKEIKLVATNPEGCIDSASVNIESVMPVVDLSIEQLQLIENGTGYQILLEIGNYSNLPVDTIQATITLEDQFVLAETISERINPGNTSRLSLNTALPATSKLSYLCVNLSSVYNVDDVNAVNNEECVNVEQETIFEPAFPNPTSGRASIRAIIPNAGNIKLSLVDLSGQVKQTSTLPNQPPGLTTFKVDLTELEAGTYFVIIEFDGGNHKSRVVKY